MREQAHPPSKQRAIGASPAGSDQLHRLRVPTYPLALSSRRAYDPMTEKAPRRRDAVAPGAASRKERAVAYLVVHESEAGSPVYHRADVLDGAVAEVERLRNEDGVEGAVIYELQPVDFEYEPYYRVAIRGDEESEPGPVAVPATAVLRALLDDDDPVDDGVVDGADVVGLGGDFGDVGEADDGGADRDTAPRVAPMGLRIDGPDGRPLRVHHIDLREYEPAEPGVADETVGRGLFMR
jgi:hypothetical protein